MFPPAFRPWALVLSPFEGGGQAILPGSATEQMERIVVLDGSLLEPSQLSARVIPLRLSFHYEGHTTFVASIQVEVVAALN
jgi:hypothetical protein